MPLIFLPRTENAAWGANLAGSSFNTSNLADAYLHQANLTGVTDYEIRVARPENGPARLLAKIPGLRVPVAHGWTIHPVVSPDGKSLALLLRDDAGNINIWSLPTQGGNLRQITDFGQRRTIIARRVSWSSDSHSMFAALAEGDSDIVLMEGVLP